MQDVEIESLLEDAGYQFDPASGQYLSQTDDDAYLTEAIADQLEIPLEDLERWEAEQREVDEAAES